VFYLLLVPVAIQALVMFIDEFYFHRKRGLLRWERMGHPLDSLSVVICYIFLLVALPTKQNIYIYCALCAFSSLLITKDEFVHSKYCEASENWLHALLFILHPLTFMAAGVIWYQGLSVEFLVLQPVAIACFMLYQIIYWSYYAED
jgi:hypothetical protein